MQMGQKDLGDLHSKLDKIFDIQMQTNVNIEKSNGDIKAIKEHLNTLNGKVLRNMEEIEKVRLAKITQADKCNAHFEKIEEAANKTEDSIVFARGSMYALTFISILLGLALGTKTLGIW